ncbi:nuclear RNA export factor 1 [Drosophila subpulchrella]|uniref:nuclear RNA export factor 1 n=1 Tax=Drosophila subpulchrella TaxID=1486046 RepID=UPI0018A19C20|nr:nuclear RNA export factor 1 [Drosophila subpulchrella]
MSFSPRQNSTEGPLCHSTPRSENYASQIESRPVANLPVSVYGWYRVLVFSSDRRESINRVLRRLRWILNPLKLDPRYKHSGGEYDNLEDSGAKFTFYVDSYNVASALFRRGRLDNRLWLKVSDRMPSVRITLAFKLRLKRVILERYDPEQRSLDLTLFHMDETWRGEFCALAEPHCMSTAVDIMEQCLPQLEHLILDRNHLTHLWIFRQSERRFPWLQRVSLKNNDITNIEVLRVFQYLPLVALNLERNLLPPAYEGQVLSIWPRLRFLNDIPVMRYN